MKTPISIAENRDCMKAMREFPDKYFDLAVVDPMYIMDAQYLIPGSRISTTGVKRNHVKQAKSLSELPPTGMDYFWELQRVSKHQIIWGINYYEFANKIKGRLIWDKMNDTSTFSNAELAACSLIQGVRIFRYLWNGMIQQDMKNKEKRIHPFQKPVALYSWILNTYAKSGDKIIDTHMGSQSSRIAAYKAGFDYWGLELSTEHFDDGNERFQKAIAMPLFDAPKPAVIQLTI